MPTLWVDVSNYQGNPNWAQVKADGVEGAIAKVNEGSSMDPAFAANWQAIQAAGLRRGAYDFGWTANDPVTEANIFLNAIKAAGGLTPSDVLVLDIEEVHGPVATGSVAQWTLTWCQTVEAATGAATGIVPWVYSYWNYITNNLQDARLSQFPLWFAYPSAAPPNAPAPWSSYVAWQYGQGNVPGIGGLVDEDNVYLNPTVSSPSYRVPSQDMMDPIVINTGSGEFLVDSDGFSVTSSGGTAPVYAMSPADYNRFVSDRQKRFSALLSKGVLVGLAPLCVAISSGGAAVVECDGSVYTSTDTSTSPAVVLDATNYNNLVGHRTSQWGTYQSKLPVSTAAGSFASSTHTHNPPSGTTSGPVG